MTLLDENNSSMMAAATDVNKLNLSENDWLKVLTNLSSSSMSSLQETLKRLSGPALGDSQQGLKKQPDLATVPTSTMMTLPNFQQGPFNNLINTKTFTTAAGSSQLLQLPILNSSTSTNNGGTILVALTNNQLNNIKTLGPNLTPAPQLANNSLSTPITTLNTQQQTSRCLNLNQILTTNQIASLLQQQQQQQQISVSKLLQSKTNISQAIVQNGNIINLCTSSSNNNNNNNSSQLTIKKDDSNSLYALATAAVEAIKDVNLSKDQDIEDKSSTLEVEEERLPGDSHQTEIAGDSQQRRCLEIKNENRSAQKQGEVTNSNIGQKRPLSETSVKIEGSEETEDNTENLEPVKIQRITRQASKETIEKFDDEEILKKTASEDEDSDGLSQEDDSYDLTKSFVGNNNNLDNQTSQLNSRIMVLRSNNGKSGEENNCDDEAARRAKRRERNRVAAARCRQRRQDQIGELQNQVTQLYQTGESLRSQIKVVEYERNRLEKQVQLHNMTECPKAITITPQSPFKATELPPLSKILGLEASLQLTPLCMTNPTQNSTTDDSTYKTQQIRPKISLDEINNSSSNESNVDEFDEKKAKQSKLFDRPTTLPITSNDSEKMIKKEDTTMSQDTTIYPSNKSQKTTPLLTPSTLRLLGQLAGTPTLNQNCMNNSFISSSIIQASQVDQNLNSPLTCLRLNSALNYMNLLASPDQTIANAIQHQQQQQQQQQQQINSRQTPNGQTPLLAITTSVENGLQIFRMISNTNQPINQTQ